MHCFSWQHANSSACLYCYLATFFVWAYCSCFCSRSIHHVYCLRRVRNFSKARLTWPPQWKTILNLSCHGSLHNKAGNLLFVCSNQNKMELLQNGIMTNSPQVKVSTRTEYRECGILEKLAKSKGLHCCPQNVSENRAVTLRILKASHRVALQC